MIVLCGHYWQLFKSIHWNIGDIVLKDAVDKEINLTVSCVFYTFVIIPNFITPCVVHFLFSLMHAASIKKNHPLGPPSYHAAWYSTTNLISADLLSCKQSEPNSLLVIFSPNITRHAKHPACYVWIYCTTYMRVISFPCISLDVTFHLVAVILSDMPCVLETKRSRSAMGRSFNLSWTYTHPITHFFLTK